MSAVERRIAVIVAAIGIILLIYVGDILVRDNLRLGVFYLVPVLLATWFEGTLWGALCVVATVVLRMTLETTQGASLGNAFFHQGPFIIVSGVIDEETAVSAIKAGAHDFITKGRLARLVPVMERELEEARVRDAQRRSERDRVLLSEAGQLLAESGQPLGKIGPHDDARLQGLTACQARGRDCYPKARPS